MITSPNIINNKLDSCLLDIELENTYTIISKVINNQNLNYIINDDIEFNTCIIKNCTFFNCKFEKSYFVDVMFENCDLSNISLINSTFKRVFFKNCKLLGSNFSDSYFENITFTECNMKNCYFDNCHLNNTLINSCNLELSIICNLKHKNLSFNDCNLTSTNFSKTSLKNIDLSSNIINGIILYPEDLKGSIMTEYQALEFVKILGIKIK